MPRRQHPNVLVWTMACLGLSVMALPIAAQDELDRVLERLMAAPNIEVEDGFTVRVLIPPGQLYDPLFMRDHDGAIWMNDDGGEEGDKGSKIVAIDAQGRISTVVALGRLLPVTGFDIAPLSFGQYQGQLFSLAQARVAFPGVARNHIIQRIDPETDADGELFCTLPMAGSGSQGIAGTGIEARFGPEGPLCRQVLRNHADEQHGLPGDTRWWMRPPRHVRG